MANVTQKIGQETNFIYALTRSDKLEVQCRMMMGLWHWAIDMSMSAVPGELSM